MRVEYEHKKKVKKRFTVKRQNFIDRFGVGLPWETARDSGYEGNRHTLEQIASQLLKNVDIVEAIQSRQASARNELIATREERQAFWSDVMRNKSALVIKNEGGGVEDIKAEVAMKDRLRAAELLGKSEADFVERIRHEGLNVSITRAQDKEKKD